MEDIIPYPSDYYDKIIYGILRPKIVKKKRIILFHQMSLV